MGRRGKVGGRKSIRLCPTMLLLLAVTQAMAQDDGDQEQAWDNNTSINMTLVVLLGITLTFLVINMLMQFIMICFQKGHLNRLNQIMQVKPGTSSDYEHIRWSAVYDEVKQPNEYDDIKKPNEYDDITKPNEYDDIKIPNEYDDIKKPNEYDDIKKPNEYDDIKKPNEYDDVKTQANIYSTLG